MGKSASDARKSTKASPEASAETLKKTSGRTKAGTSAGAVSEPAKGARSKTVSGPGVKKPSGITKAANGSKKKLVIVESPSKAKTIGRFLDSSYKVIASVGHVRDLPKSKLGVDIDNDFEPQYITIRGKGDIIKELRRESKNASAVYLATDPDREGEAISWHLAALLDIDPGTKCRVTFNEITRNAVRAALKEPRAIDIRLVDAQQARRVLDRLVGYQISPLLWRKIKRGLSAGRVQSAALKIICDREREIEAFVPEEYWTVTADFKKGKAFSARLATYRGKKLTIHNEEEKNIVMEELSKGNYKVASVQRKERTVRPYPPYTTSSLQQDASIRLNFNTGRTMRIAQQLYEGVAVHGRGTTGLITYLRTDSVRISSEAKAAAGSFIKENFGEQYAGNNFYAKKKDAQDAHEAIRPTDITLTPGDVKPELTPDQYKLYKLIWERFTASQMTPAVYSGVRAGIENGDYGFYSTGSSVVFDGFRRVYKPSKLEEKDAVLPELIEGEELNPERVRGEQNFTQPPSRYTEASLVRELETRGIGRPSTYAPIVVTLTERKYVRREKRTLIPTDMGKVVNETMETYFSDIVDSGFTAGMEEKLDRIAEDDEDWKQVIRTFYGPFSEELRTADSRIEKIVVPDRPAGVNCEICGRPMVIKNGKYGEFMACSGFPECRNIRSIAQEIGVDCPSCGKPIVKKRAKSGRIFYGCSGYPDCTQVFWNRPVKKICPECGSLLVEKKTAKGRLACSNPKCRYTE